ncbi:signal transduction histidine kinase [Rhodococcus sp. SMB37]|uniref:sensor histidine kinase n=1 Tax=Rhodococcus sp. SMB37 TaxID=2512213 RepID=UPI001051CA53|nr:ATP-binding protein [Rhodococcus sp. SMB37]TCN41610.1 signal transduction histidine kinase [Rhodococcus sp. SMB37]
MSLFRNLRLPTPDNWRLWQKVTAVVAVPLIAASLYGGLRVYDTVQEARHYSEQAERVTIIPSLAQWSMGVGGAALATMIHLPTDNAAAIISESEPTLDAFLADPDLDPQLMAQVSRAIQEGEALYQSAAQGGASREALHEQLQRFVSRITLVFRSIVDASGDSQVLADAGLLLATWDTQWEIIDQIVAFGALMDGSDAASLMFTNAQAAEAGKLALFLENVSDPETASTLNGLMDQRRALIAGIDDASTDVSALRNSIFATLTIYQEVVDGAGTRIVTTLDDLASTANRNAWGTAIGVAVVLTLALGLALLVAASLIRPLRRLRNDTLRAAEVGLPDAIADIKNGADIETVSLEPIRVTTREEIGEVARAVDNMSVGALRLAGEQAALRRQVNEMLETLARRNKTLVEQQLTLIDSLEHEERDPTRLQNLFALDHLAARMRRTGDSLLVLAGTRQRMGRVPDTPLGDVLRAAVSQVENYQRVDFGNAPEGSLLGSSVTDIVHLVAELLDNALRASPPDSTVAFAFSRAVDGGLLLEIADRGIGIPAEELAEINERLSSDDEGNWGAARRMGLFVVARLAARNGITVRLRPTFDSTTNAGITASVYLPIRLLKGVGNSVTDTYQIDRPRRLQRSATETEHAINPYPLTQEISERPAGQLPQRNSFSDNTAQYDANPQYDSTPHHDPEPQYGSDSQYGNESQSQYLPEPQYGQNPQHGRPYEGEQGNEGDGDEWQQDPAPRPQNPGTSPTIQRGRLHERWPSRRED